MVFGTVNLQSFVVKDFLRNKWKYELTVHFKYEMIVKHFHRNFELTVFELTMPDLYQCQPRHRKNMSTNYRQIWLAVDWTSE